MERQLGRRRGSPAGDSDGGLRVESGAVASRSRVATVTSDLAHERYDGSREKMRMKKHGVWTGLVVVKVVTQNTCQEDDI